MKRQIEEVKQSFESKLEACKSKAAAQEEAIQKAHEKELTDRTAEFTARCEVKHCKWKLAQVTQMP